MEFVCDNDVCRLVPKSEPQQDLESIRKKAKNMPKPSDNTNWTIYGVKKCPYCVKAKELAKEKEIDHVYVNIEKYMTKGEFKQIMANKTDNYNFVPIIFNKNKFIGGFTQMESILLSTI